MRSWRIGALKSLIAGSIFLASFCVMADGWPQARSPASGNSATFPADAFTKFRQIFPGLPRVGSVSSTAAVSMQTSTQYPMYLAGVTSDYYNQQAWTDPFVNMNWVAVPSKYQVTSTNSTYPMKSSWVGFAFFIDSYYFPVSMQPMYEGKPLIHYVPGPTLTQNPAIIGTDPNNGYVNV